MQKLRKGKNVQIEEEEEEEDSQMTGAQEEADEGPTPIASLEDKGINKNDIKKLEEAGFKTVESIAFTPKKTLVNVKGLSEAKIDKILEAAHSLVDLGFSTAKAFFEKRKK